MINEENKNKIYIRPLLESIKDKLLAIILITAVFTGSMLFFAEKLVDPKFESVGSMLVEVKVDNSDITFQDMLSYKNYVSKLIVETIKSDDFINKATKSLEFDATSEQIKRDMIVSLNNDTQLIEIRAQENSAEKSSAIVLALLETSIKDIPMLFADTQLKTVNLPVNGTKVSPNQKNIIFLSGAFSFIVVMGVVFLKFIVDTRIKDVEQLEDLLNIPILGKIQRGDAQSFPFLNINIMYKMKQAEAKTLLITSSLKGDGKSYVCHHLAEELSKFEMQVLVIGIGRKSKYTSHKESNYDYISIDNVSEENSKVKISQTRSDLEKYKEEYDFIIVDACDITRSPDAQLLSQICDEVLFIVKNETEWNVIVSSLKKLEMVDAQVMGIVWNDYRNA